MHHAITIGELLLSVGIIAGTLTAAYGVVDAYGNMMADAAGDNGNQGCVVALVGLALIVGCIARLVL